MINVATVQPSPKNDISINQQKRNENLSKPVKKKHSITTKTTTNKKLIVSEGQYCNNEEREALQNKLHPTMLDFPNFLAGRNTKTARKLESMKSPISIIDRSVTSRRSEERSIDYSVTSRRRHRAVNTASL